jgi:hypothetical protein
MNLVELCQIYSQLCVFLRIVRGKQTRYKLKPKASNRSNDFNRHESAIHLHRIRFQSSFCVIVNLMKLLAELY